MEPPKKPPITPPTEGRGIDTAPPHLDLPLDMTAAPGAVSQNVGAGKIADLPTKFREVVLAIGDKLTGANVKQA